ncbi:MAG: VacB/RNase II family 3'-5' exoribonuclease, partial [Planctomycetales bacterium]|nr:VacB/RNase II family 3'-5' exoribonuclease [Planctomycetales bacterium]
IIHEFNLPGPFAPDVLEDAREQADSFDAAVEADRRDLTDQTVITIDPEDARDFDDAISLDQIEGGHWRLGVHIADVAHFVREKSPLDREARQRATSVYLPDRVIPMLPETISNNLASLQPHRVRYTKSVFIEFAPDGAVMGAEACAAAIRSQRRFTYEEVDDYRANPRRWRRKLKVEVYELLGRMYTLAMILRKRRFDRGALELTLPEVKIDLDRDGRVAGAHLVENTESHQVIEEFMLAANEAVARILQEAGIVFLRRIHEPPDPRKLQELTLFARELGLEVTSLESRFALQGLLNQLEGRPEEHAVSYATLRSMQKAVYSPAEEGHFALASDCYCHFTSPIRRYPDLTVHRLLDALLASRAPRQHVDELANLGDHCSQREQRAEQAERELIKVKLLNYLSERIGEEMDAVVTGVQEFGLFVQGVQLPAEGLIHVTSLQDDYYHYDRGTHSLSGHRAGHSFRLGDYLRVAVAHVDVDRRELDFRLVRRLSSRPAGPAPKPKTQRAGKTRRTRKPSTPQRATPRSEPASPPPGKGRRKTAPQGQVGEGKKDRAKKGRAKKDGGKNSRGKKGGAKKGGAKNSRGKKSGAKPGGGKKGAAKKGRGAKKGGQRKGKK